MLHRALRTLIQPKRFGRVAGGIVTVVASDSGTGTDTALIGVVGADTTAAVDLATLAASVAGATDTGAGSESAAISQVSTDTATGTDTSTVTAAVTSTDTATATESATTQES